MMEKYIKSFDSLGSTARGKYLDVLFSYVKDEHMKRTIYSSRQTIMEIDF